jgi:hypothetical protein
LLDNPDLRAKLSATSPSAFALSEFAKALTERTLTPKLEQVLLELLPFATEQLPLASEVKTIPEPARAFFIQLTASNMAKNAFIYSTRERRSQIASYEKAIKSLEEEQKKCKRTKPCKHDQDIDAMRQTIQILKTTPSGPLAAFTAFRKALVDAEILNAEELVNTAMNVAKGTFATEIRTSSLTLREGDIWTQLSQGGAGDFFMQVSQNGTFATHSGAVVREFEDGFPIWFTVEMGGGVRFSPISTEDDRVFWRPSFATEPGFTAEALKNLDALGEVEFDVHFTPGLFDSHGKPSLYCSELVHYLFKNRFNPKGHEYTSPFDGMRSTLTHLTTTAQKNMRLLGHNPTDDKFAPESFHYSPHINFVGFKQTDSWIPSDDFIDYMNSIGKRLNADIASLISTKTLAPVPFIFQREVDAALLVGNFSYYILPLLPQPKADALRSALWLRNILPDGMAKYYFARTAIQYQKAQSVLQPQRDSSGNLPPNWKETIELKYKNEVIPAIKSLFTNAVQ